jgi:hypothetical protein
LFVIAVTTLSLLDRSSRRRHSRHVPEISRFFGLVIAMLYNGHAPPHFHVRYGAQHASVTIDPPALLAGKLRLARLAW